jgi:hypothetical protein
VWLRIDYNGHGFDAFVTDINLGRTRVFFDMPDFPKPDQWTHLALTWDETKGILGGGLRSGVIPERPRFGPI